MKKSDFKAVIVENRHDVKSVIDSHMKYLPGWDVEHINNPSIKTANDYNYLLTSVDFWKQFQDYNKVLIFQHDSGLLRSGIEEFLEWDYVGAPWHKNAAWARKDRAGGNGGLSLRCPKKSLALSRYLPYHPREGNEDVYFTHHLEKVGGKVAPYEVCKQFSVETVFQLGTLGYHAIDKHLSLQECDQIASYGNIRKPPV